VNSFLSCSRSFAEAISGYESSELVCFLSGLFPSDLV